MSFELKFHPHLRNYQISSRYSNLPTDLSLDQTANNTYNPETVQKQGSTGGDAADAHKEINLFIASGRGNEKQKSDISTVMINATLFTPRKVFASFF